MTLEQRMLRRNRANSGDLELSGEFRSANFRIHVALANVETLVAVAKLDRLKSTVQDTST